jgi:SCY1-like protein 1
VSLAASLPAYRRFQTVATATITVKDGADKDAFFKRLPGLIPAIPQPVAARKLLPLLARALEFGGAPASALGSLLLIGR